MANYLGHLRHWVTYRWDAVDMARNTTLYISDGNQMTVRVIKFRNDIAGTNASAVTGVLRKVPAATALTGGVVLHSGTMDLKAAANSVTAPVLTLTLADLVLNDGDALVFQLTGTSTAAQGCVTVGMEALT